MCRAPCYIIDRTHLVTYDVIGTIIFPILIILIANLFLIFRVVYQKRQHHVAWRRQRKLTMQLLIIALIYIIFWFPMAFNGLAFIFTSSYLSEQIQTNYFIFLVYIVPILLPFILLATLPELIKKIFRKQQQRIIRPG
jgi:cytochrome c biogenesis protein CcdA